MQKYVDYEECVKDGISGVEKYVDGNLGVYDFQKMADNGVVVGCYMAVSQFVNKHKRKPINWSNNDSM